MVPDSVVRFPEPGEFAEVRAFSLPAAAEGLFEEVFLCGAAKEAVVRGADSILRAIADFKVAGRDSFKRVHEVWKAEDGSSLGVLWERDKGKDLHPRYLAYLANLDRMFAERAFKSFHNLSRVAVCRMVDQTGLGEEARATYAKYLRRNAAKAAEYFEDNELELMGRMLPQALAAAEAALGE